MAGTIPFSTGTMFTVIFGLLSGVNSAIAIGLLYACLAIGAMNILSPLTAVMSAIVPVTVGLMAGGTLDVIANMGIWVGVRNRDLSVIAVFTTPLPRQHCAARARTLAPVA